MIGHSDRPSLAVKTTMFAKEKRMLLYNVDSRMRYINTKWAY